MPVYNDWAIGPGLIKLINDNLSGLDCKTDLLLVDDGSTLPLDFSTLNSNTVPSLNSFEALILGRNVGHQRAIAIGLAHIAESRSYDAVIVMDSDGEDDPKDIPRLIAAFEEGNRGKLVFAKRTRRSEKLLFRTFYVFYRALHKLLTGHTISFGNFSIIPKHILSRAVLLSEIWNHYAAGIIKSRVPYTSIPTVRAKRLAGQSQMNFTSLVMHGLSSIAVHSDTIGVRALMLCAGLAALTVLGMMIILGVKLFTNLGIPGWASTSMFALFIILFQALTSSLIFSFMILQRRSGQEIIPKRDHKVFLLEVRKEF